MGIKIGLAGNPNSGKTTLFNELTGSNQYVGNWPGVTVEKKEGKSKRYQDVTVVDLPGIYSLSPYSPEEVVTRDFLMNEKPDVIINLVDASNLERNLYLTTQLMEVGIPVVIALNMIDVVEKNGDIINIEAIEKQLGCPMIPLSALKGQGLDKLMDTAIDYANHNKRYNETAAINTMLPVVFDHIVEEALASIQNIAGDIWDTQDKRYYSIKIFERDSKVMEAVSLDEAKMKEVNKEIKKVETALDDDADSIITTQRYDYIGNILINNYIRRYHGQMTPSDKIDHIVTNRWLALPIFALVMFLIYYVSITTVGTIMTDWVNDVLFGEIIPPAMESFLTSIDTAPWLIALVIDGILAGVGGVLGFLPQMMVLFLFLALLEDCGYMARIAFIMDRIFRKFGLSGKSFIPILIGTGCSVPGIMASRTIESDNDRRMTIITTSFMPCSAKLPIIALIAGAIFPQSPWVGPSAYFVGIAAIIISGVILKKTKLFSGDPAPFVMELPTYHVPSLKSVLIHMWERAQHFIEKAGTIILLSSIIVWFLSNYSWKLQMVDAEESILAFIGNVFAPLFAPLGWGNWQSAVAAFTGLIAKENVVGTLGVLYGFEEVAENGAEIWTTFHGAFTALSAYSFLVFNLLCAPCFATVGAVRSEMGSAKWTWFTVGYQTGLAYAVSFTIYQIGTWITVGTFSTGTALALLLIIGLLYLLVRKPKTIPNVKKDTGVVI